MKIALVHDYLTQYGGGERVLEVFCEMYPEAPIYTLLYDEKATGGVFRGREIHTSFLQKLPLAKKHHRLFPLLMPMAAEQFDLSEFDTVVSVSASFAKGIITKPHTRHINYCLTPTRFLWDDSHRYLKESFQFKPLHAAVQPFLSYLRAWDKEASYRVDEYVAISQFVRGRIKKYYQQDAQVIYPPVDTEKYGISREVDDYFLMVGRLVGYKKVNLAVGAFGAMGLPLKIVGDGPMMRKLKAQSEKCKNIKFLGLVSDNYLPELYSRCRALVFPQEEDFGLVPLETMASGRPVIAYRGGGALETVVDGITGVFFDQQTEIDLSLAVGRLLKMEFDPAAIRAHAQNFDVNIFKNKMRDIIEADAKTEYSLGSI